MATTAPDIETLYQTLLHGRAPMTDAYKVKQWHPVPVAPVVKRDKFILERCVGQVVLDVGASGPMHDAVTQVATAVYGLDRASSSGVQGFDLDDVSQQTLPAHPDVTLVLCGEVLEHLSNPGWFLTRLRRQYACPLLVTVPNAFSLAASRIMGSGVENVNIDHVCWYSTRTLRTLLERHGYAWRELAWYHGEPRTAEGLIVVAD